MKNHRYEKYADEDLTLGKKKIKQNLEEIGNKEEDEKSQSAESLWGDALNLISSSRKVKSLIAPKEKEILQKSIYLSSGVQVVFKTE